MPEVFRGCTLSAHCRNRGLATLGANVTMISTKAFNTNQLDKLSVRVLPPVVGSQQLGFASAVGSFDSILDTLYNERDPLDNLPYLYQEKKVMMKTAQTTVKMKTAQTTTLTALKI